MPFRLKTLVIAFVLAATIQGVQLPILSRDASLDWGVRILYSSQKVGYDDNSEGIHTTMGFYSGFGFPIGWSSTIVFHFAIGGFERRAALQYEFLPAQIDNFSLGITAGAIHYRLHGEDYDVTIAENSDFAYIGGLVARTRLSTDVEWVIRLQAYPAKIKMVDDYEPDRSTIVGDLHIGVSYYPLNKARSRGEH